MKALPIDKEFTTQYVKDLHQFFKMLNTKAHTVKFCHNSAQTSLGQFSNDLETIIRSFHRRKKPITTKLSLSPNLLLEIEDRLLKRNKNRRFMLSLGGWVSIKDGILSRQSFCIAVLCEINNDMNLTEAEQSHCHPLKTGTHVLRKFHFDLDRTLSDDYKWPPSHLQYGGGFRPEHFAVDNGLQYHLYSPLDHPRFPAMPYNLILCVDLALRSFTTSGTALTKESFWKKQIKESETRWIRPFLVNTLDFLNANQQKETLWDYFSSKK